MSSQLEKVFLHSHSLHLQHLFPYPRHHLLHRRTRHLLLSPLSFFSPLRSCSPRLRQSPPVDLPVLRQRHLLHHHHRPGTHVLRQPSLQLLPHFSPFHSFFSRDVPHQAPVSSLPLLHYHYRLLHSSTPSQRLLHLPQLDPVSPQLHLIVLPPHELQVPILSPPRTVSRPVQPLSSSRCTVRVRHKALRCHLRPVQIPTRQSRSSDVQLPHHSHRHRLHPPVQHIHLRVPDRPSDRHLLLFLDRSLHPVATGKHRVLRRSTPVDQHTLLQHSPRLPHIHHLHHLPAAQQLPHSLQLLQLLLHHLVE